MYSDWKKLLKAVEAHGFTVIRTKDGWMFRAADGIGSAGIHGTPSDRRAFMNAVKDIQRADPTFKWPPLSRKQQRAQEDE